jgi:hypothetical protein
MIAKFRKCHRLWVQQLVQNVVAYDVEYVFGQFIGGRYVGEGVQFFGVQNARLVDFMDDTINRLRVFHGIWVNVCRGRFMDKIIPCKGRRWFGRSTTRTHIHARFHHGRIRFLWRARDTNEFTAIQNVVWEKTYMFGEYPKTEMYIWTKQFALLHVTVEYF